MLIDQSEHIVQRYRAAGLNARLVVLEEAGHGGKEFFRNANFNAAKEFLNQHAPQRTAKAATIGCD